MQLCKQRAGCRNCSETRTANDASHNSPKQAEWPTTCPPHHHLRCLLSSRCRRCCRRCCCCRRRCRRCCCRRCCCCHHRHRFPAERQLLPAPAGPNCRSCASAGRAHQQRSCSALLALPLAPPCSLHRCCRPRLALVPPPAAPPAAASRQTAGQFGGLVGGQQAAAEGAAQFAAQARHPGRPPAAWSRRAPAPLPPAAGRSGAGGSGVAGIAAAGASRRGTGSACSTCGGRVEDRGRFTVTNGWGWASEWAGSWTGLPSLPLARSPNASAATHAHSKSRRCGQPETHPPAEVQVCEPGCLGSKQCCRQYCKGIALQLQMPQCWR